jgi:hypothetical protein
MASTIKPVVEIDVDSDSDKSGESYDSLPSDSNDEVDIKDSLEADVSAIFSREEDAKGDEKVDKIAEKEESTAKPKLKAERKVIKAENANEATEAKTRKGAQVESMLRENMCRVKPDLVADRPKEQRHLRTATLGVVQLFNAIAERRKHVETELNRPELKYVNFVSIFCKNSLKNLKRRSLLIIYKTFGNLCRSEFKRDRVRERLRLEGEEFEAKLQGKAADGNDGASSASKPKNKKQKLTKQKWLSDNVADVIKPDSD